MKLSLSPNISQKNSFRAGVTTNVLNGVLTGQQVVMPKKKMPILENKNQLSEKDKIEIQSKRVKSAVKRCIGVILLVDIIYFAMKRTFKYSKIDHLKKLAEQKKGLTPPVRLTELPPPNAPYPVVIGG